MKKAYLYNFGSQIRNLPQFSLRRLASFSSCSAATPESPSFSTEEDEVKQGGSAVYRHVLRHQRPASIRCKPELYNSVSFIGRVDRPLEIYKTKGDTFGAYTFIEVRNPSDPNRTFRMRVEMWNDVAKTGIQHLKQNDDIYVSGCLGSYEMPDKNGNLVSIYKVNVKELCYVAQHDQHSTAQKTESKACQVSDELQLKASKKSEEQSGDGNNMENYKNRLDLWQLFFCKPCEWWDKRKSKQNPELPDFKHKYNGENLWLRPDDPPWVKRHLQLLDMEIAKQRQANGVGKSGMMRYSNRHHLWQVFFSNPHEWWDNRKNKTNRRSPDFKHKDTGEALWIMRDDPPWVKRQLKLLDFIMAEQCVREKVGSGSQLSEWIFDA
ncbi:conserved hypothetical protein [Ricinus communis]|uniref:Uncharacterized protein n=1 Tax=Ricinus communis TaxID=3988 RepID=B9R7I5_RICCO|nr:conserved hypothetical protein [Ricinus communis]|eukprot:XP_002510278.1 protein OSB1, mitochondrial [Ricinus communis]